MRFIQRHKRMVIALTAVAQFFMLYFLCMHKTSYKLAAKYINVTTTCYNEVLNISVTKCFVSLFTHKSNVYN